MEEVTQNLSAAEAGKNAQSKVQTAYPAEPIMFCINLVRQIVDAKGELTPITLKDISLITNKAVGTLVMKVSTCVQYGLLVNKFGQGYLPGVNFKSYMEPVFGEEDRKIALLKMFSTPPLYQKLINDLNGKYLPALDGFAIHLKNDYGLNPNSAEKAAKVFLENARSLNIIDNNRLKIIYKNGGSDQSDKKTEKPEDLPPTPVKHEFPADNLFELPIPLGGGRKAFIRYPLEDLKKRDIKIIVKALAFIASSIDDENGEEFEISITELKDKN